MSRDYIYLDELDLPQPGRWVGGCTCAAFDHVHEPACGWDIDDEPATTPGPTAALPYAGVPLR